NAAGAWLAGAVPHRGPAGRALDEPGASVGSLGDAPRKLVFLLGVDPALDCAEARALRRALAGAECVVALSGFGSPALEELADVMLPTAVYAENEGSYVNLNGDWQSFEAAVRPRGEARPAWKILRMLGATLDLHGFDAVTCADVTTEIKSLVGEVKAGARATPTLDASPHAIDGNELELLVEVPMYACDALVRRAPVLQAMPQAGDDSVRMSAATAARLSLGDGEQVALSVEGSDVVTTLAIDDGLADGVCLVDGARAALAELAVNGAAVRLTARGDAAA
ncbi:MAG: molybdopterin-dependent oxidoreductase, partial [Gammaproteobacteria bacterium]